MPTAKQELGKFGEESVCRHLKRCPRCKRKKTLKRLPTNFKCADIICDFCSYVAQVKTCRSTNIDKIPDTIVGAAWAPQKARMNSANYSPLFLVLVSSNGVYKCYYLAADLQTRRMFKPRKPLSKTAKRSGWKGFMYYFKGKQHLFVHVFSGRSSKIARKGP